MVSTCLYSELLLLSSQLSICFPSFLSLNNNSSCNIISIKTITLQQDDEQPWNSKTGIHQTTTPLSHKISYYITIHKFNFSKGLCARLSVNALFLHSTLLFARVTFRQAI